MSVSYTKPYKTTSDIIALLKGRGLLVPDTKEAENYIDNIGYYRFSAYLYPLVASPKSAQQFKKGATFNSAVNLYRFDKKLRLLLFNEIEKIEISLRSAIANIGIKETGNRFWMTERAMFASSSKFNRTMELIDKEYGNSKEDFINHFKNKYDNPYPPAWILVEILPLGVLTRIYENIADNALRKKIAAHFQLGVPVFLSWLTVITLTRNACCHHSRIWNRQHPIEPMMPRKITRP